MKTSWLATLSAIAVLVAVSRAEAQSTDGAVRLGFDFSFLGLDVLTVDPEAGSEETTLEVSSGFAFDNTFLNAGYGLSDRLTLGLRLRSGSIARVFPDRDDDPSEASYHLTGLPYLEVNLTDGGTLRPFIGPTLGLDLTVFEQRLDDRGDPDLQRADAMFMFGAFFGARVFINETFAFEPTLVATYGVGGFAEERVGDAEVDGTTSTFTIMLLFGGSVWLGAERSPRPAPPPDGPGAYEPMPYPAAPAPEPAPAAAPPPPPPATAPPPPAPTDTPATPAPEQVPPPPPPPPPATAPAP
jgi:hypothetical protein